MRALGLFLLLISLTSCQPNTSHSEAEATTTDSAALKSLPSFAPLEVTKAMRRVMWQGKLDASIRLDSIVSKQKHFYGIGPLEGLQGELLVWNDTVYLSQCFPDSLSVCMANRSGAPFFVGAYSDTWEPVEWDPNIRGLKDLENYLLAQYDSSARFAFRLMGSIDRAKIHVQNHADGAVIRSPEQAHAGQVHWELPEQEVLILGFFSTQDQGVFTHHDSFLHLHLLSADKQWMGHLDSIQFKKMHLEIALSP